MLLKLATLKHRDDGKVDVTYRTPVGDDRLTIDKASLILYSPPRAASSCAAICLELDRCGITDGRWSGYCAALKQWLVVLPYDLVKG